VSDGDILAKAKADFAECQKDPAQNREAYEEDMRFVRLLEQWPQEILTLRKGRPMLVFDRLGQAIRQVVNDSRQNKPSIKTHPVDSEADVKTAEVLDGLIRNVEYSSNADVAYDTSVDCAVGGGFGYFRIGADYARDDTFEMDLSIERIPNPLCVYPDPNSQAADSSDWNKAFVVSHLTKEDYENQYGDAEKINWNDDAWKGWIDDEGVIVAEYWTREEYEKTIVKTADGRTFDKAALTEDPDLATALEAGLIVIAAERVTKCYRVTQHFCSGAKVLKTSPWPGRYIPIIPVYGDEFWVDGKRYLRSLIHGAKDAQTMFNVMRSVSVELYGKSPKVPWLVEDGAIPEDEVEKWNTANSADHPFLLYAKGAQVPQRTPLDPGPAVGAMNEAMAAADDIKAITGIYDASLGARSNETSGKAIMARQREGDTSTFHFIDNLRRAIRHAGRVLIDLIPHYYDMERVIRVIGEDGKEEAVKINQQFPQVDPKTGQPMQQPVMGPDGQPQVDPVTGQPLMQPVLAMHDLTTGKYDVTVSSGPSFTTRREEAAYSMTEALRAFPAGADIIMPELAKNLDWPGADKIAEKLEQKAAGAIPPQVQQKIQEGMAELEKLRAENAQLKQDQQAKMADIQSDAEIAKFEAELDAQTALAVAQIETAARSRVEQFKARINAQAQAQRPIVQAAPRQAA
jgi:hypothetical protein